jgi:hypothetical protein
MKDETSGSSFILHPSSFFQEGIMRKTLERAGWKLMLAGTLAGATSAAALAQTPPDGGTGAPPPPLPEAAPGRTVALVGTPDGPSHMKIRSGAAAMSQEAAARLSEIKVELAWLGDPATCPCPLTAHAFGLNLEIRGAVPSEAVRAQAVKLAKEQSTLAVMDALQVQPDLAMPQPMNQPAENLAMAAATAFNESLPRYCFGVNIGAMSNGTVTVEGMIPSYEEKLAVSRRLGKLHGCTCVANRLTVTALQRDGHACCQVTANGGLWVPAEPSAVPASTHLPAPAVVHSDRVSYPPAQPAPVVRARSHGLLAWAADKLGFGGRTEEVVEEAPAPSGTSQGRWAPPPPPVAVSPYTNATASRWITATPVTTAPPVPPISPYAGFPSREVMPAATEVAGAPGREVMPLATDVADAPNPEVPAPVAVAPVSTLPPAPVVSTLPAAAPAKVAAPHPAVQPVVQVADWKGKETAPMPTPPVAMPAVPAPPAPALPAGSIVMGAADTPPPAPARAMVAPLKQRVLATCGRAARDVEVIARSDTNLVIRLKVQDVPTGERVGPQILAIPELEPYQVDLEVQIQR